jgi:hypothetical protein
MIDQKDDDSLSGIYFQLTMAKYDQCLDPLLVQRSDLSCTGGGHEKVRESIGEALLTFHNRSD